METIRFQSAALVVIVLTLFSVNMVQSLTCYVCTYTGTGTDSDNCLNPTSSTPTLACDSAVYTGCGKNTFTAAAGSTTPSTASRYCALTPSGCNLLINGAGTTITCNCGTDRCNGETTSSSSSVTTENSTVNRAGSIRPQMLYLVSLVTLGAAVFTGRLRM